ncbi:MAG: hypothetical protein R2705_24845 [Ilumatobacteraceae bacterium]
MNGDRGASLGARRLRRLPVQHVGARRRQRMGGAICEDLELFAELGVGHLRLGLDWSRLQPVEDRSTTTLVSGTNSS